MLAHVYLLCTSLQGGPMSGSSDGERGEKRHVVLTPLPRPTGDLKPLTFPPGGGTPRGYPPGGRKTQKSPKTQFLGIFGFFLQLRAFSRNDYPSLNSRPRGGWGTPPWGVGPAPGRGPLWG